MSSNDIDSNSSICNTPRESLWHTVAIRGLTLSREPSSTSQWSSLVLQVSQWFAAILTRQNILNKLDIFFYFNIILDRCTKIGSTSLKAIVWCSNWWWLVLKPLTSSPDIKTFRHHGGERVLYLTILLYNHWNAIHLKILSHFRIWSRYWVDLWNLTVLTLVLSGSFQLRWFH